MITGPPGSGKSSLALELIAMGATLIADDLVDLSVRDGVLQAAGRAPRGLVEARGLGVLRLPAAEAHGLHAVIDLGEVETERLPPRRYRDMLGVSLPLLFRPPRLNAAILAVYLRSGGAMDPEAPLSALS